MANAHWVATSKDRGNLSVSYLDSEWTPLVFGHCYDYFFEDYNWESLTTPNAPAWSVTASYEHVFAMGSMASHLNDKNVDILVIQSILGHSSTRSTEPYIHPSLDSIRKAMEKLPGVKYVKELIRTGELNLRFQKRFKPK